MANVPLLPTGLFTTSVNNAVSSKDLKQKKSTGATTALPISPSYSSGKTEQQNVNDDTVSRIRVFFEKTILSAAEQAAESEDLMEFFNSAVDTLQTIVVGLGGALCVWGGINLLEGYGQDNPGSKSQGVKQFMAN